MVFSLSFPPEATSCLFRKFSRIQFQGRRTLAVPPSLKDIVQVSPAHESFLVAQAGTALGAAASQDLTAVGGSHSLAEAVDLLAVELLGLIGTFRCHVETPPVRFPSALRRHLLDTAA